MRLKYENKQIMVLTSALLFLLFITIVTEIPLLFCWFHRLTGLYCPGCGMTRAIKSIISMGLYQAFRYNALIFIIPPIFCLYSYFNYKKNEKITKILLIIMLIITVGYGVIRNVPYFDYLAPTLV